MADYESGLPIRSESDGLDERVHVKIVDGINPAVNQATVDSDKNLKVGAYGNRCDDAADIALALSEEGFANGRGDYHGDDNSCPASAGLVAGIRSVNNLATDQTEHITSIESADNVTRSLDTSMHQSDGEAITPANPLPVTLSASTGTELHDFEEEVDVVKDASETHEISVADGDTFQLAQVLASASGKMKVEVEIGDGGVAEVFATKAVRFNSTADPQADMVLAFPIEVVGTVNTTTVRVTLTNLDKQPQSLYSTIIGVTI